MAGADCVVLELLAAISLSVLYYANVADLAISLEGRDPNRWIRDPHHLTIDPYRRIRWIAQRALVQVEPVLPSLGCCPIWQSACRLALESLSHQPIAVLSLSGTLFPSGLTCPSLFSPYRAALGDLACLFRDLTPLRGKCMKCCVQVQKFEGLRCACQGVSKNLV